MAEEQTNEPEITYDVTPPEGRELPEGVADRFRATFEAEGLTAEQAQSVQAWHWRLSAEADSHAQEQAILAPHERAAMEAQRQELTTRRLRGERLSNREEQTLKGIYERLATEREQERK